MCPPNIFASILTCARLYAHGGLGDIEFDLGVIRQIRKPFNYATFDFTLNQLYAKHDGRVHRQAHCNMAAALRCKQRVLGLLMIAL